MNEALQERRRFGVYIEDGDVLREDIERSDSATGSASEPGEAPTYTTDLLAVIRFPRRHRVLLVSWPHDDSKTITVNWVDTEAKEVEL